jgi:uncharacterized RDD family membrane protein YckC
VDEPHLPADVDWRASLGSRLAARLVDALLLAVPSTAVTLAVVDLDADRIEVPLWVRAATLVLAAVYEIACVALTGQTVGKRLLHIKVVDVTTGQPPRLDGASIRYLVPSVPALLPGIGAVLTLVVYLSAAWSPTRQGWHDRAAGTVVVRAGSHRAVPDSPATGGAGSGSGEPGSAQPGSAPSGGGGTPDG